MTWLLSTRNSKRCTSSLVAGISLFFQRLSSTAMALGQWLVLIFIDFAAISIEYPEIPEIKGVVRGNVIIGGWLLKPVENGTKVTLIYIFIDRCDIYDSYWS